MNKNILLRIILVISYLIPFIIAVTSIYLGNIPFWYDPARDLLSGLANLQKISLIGQTSGIPGIFYGPYWIWSISLAQLISKDPRVIVLTILTIPYFVLLPIILTKFKEIFDSGSPILLWLLFIVSFSFYSTQIWNPHLAPIFCFLVILFLSVNNYEKKSKNSLIRVFIAGLSGGMLMNFHISFGLSVIIGSYIYLITRKNKLRAFLLFVLGNIFTFLPFFVFELRHGFNQIKTVFATLNSASSVVVDSSNIDKLQIISQFFNKFSGLLQIHPIIGNILLVIGIVYVVVLYRRKKLNFGFYEKQLLLLIIVISITTLSIYLFSKNPVWEYHFIGVEILFLLLLGVFVTRFSIVKKALIIWIAILMIFKINTFIKEFSDDPYKLPTLRTKEYIVETIFKDAGNNTFSYYAFNPLHFTPDYDYLFLWKENEDFSSKLTEEGEGSFVYLIIPWTTNDLRDDFIDNRTPNENFKTIKSWKIADETTILKRVRYETN